MTKKKTKTSQSKSTPPVKQLAKAKTGGEPLVIAPPKKQEKNRIDARIEAGKKNLEKGKFKPGQSGNSNWRPKKIYKSIALQLKAKGYPPAKKAEIQEAMEILLNLPKSVLFAAANDEEYPHSFRIVAREMLTTKAPVMLEKILDRAFWKPKQEQEHSGDIWFNLAGALIELGRKKQQEK